MERKEKHLIFIIIYLLSLVPLVY